MRRGFAALAWPSHDGEAWSRARQLGRCLDASGVWRRAGAVAGLHVWITAAAPFRVVPLSHDAGFVVGDIFDMPGADRRRSPVHTPFPPHRTPRDLAEGLARSHWGQYVALLQGAEATAVFREPTGMVDCLTWSLEGAVEVLTSDFTRMPTELRPRAARLNWDHIAAFVAVPTAATTASLLDDVDAVGPGELLTVGPRPQIPDVIWSPLDFAADGVDDLAAAGRELVQRVDACTSELVSGHDRILVELSGGLDSSVVSAAVGATDLTERVAQWINFRDPRPEADETRFARAVTDRLGVDLTVAPRTPAQLHEHDLAELATQFWPALAGVDADRDRDEVARLEATGASAILSGQGGDGCFLQMGSSLVFDDELRRRGMRALVGPVLPNLARRTHQSVWRVLGEVIRARRDRLPKRKIVNAFVTAGVQAAAADVEHAWVTQAQASDLPLGKKLHVRAISINHFNHQISRRRRVADLLFPLLSQPVTELCLSIPTPDLAGGSYDRPFQRAAFADRLPEAVRARRAKGNLSVHFARLMANSVGWIRPYLLDGCLCRAGVLDRVALARALESDHLIMTPAANDLVGALATEAWVRHWQTRLPDSLTSHR